VSAPRTGTVRAGFPALRLLPRVRTANACRMRAKRLADRKPGSEYGACKPAFPWSKLGLTSPSAGIARFVRPASQLTDGVRLSGTVIIGSAPRLPDATAVLMTITHCRRSDRGYPRFRRDLFALDWPRPRGTTMPRIKKGLQYVAFDHADISAPASSSFSWLTPTPKQRVYASCSGVTAASRNTSCSRRLARLTWAGLKTAVIAQLRAGAFTHQ